MKEFVFGTDEQYELLRAELEDGRCHIYHGCKMPEGCVPDTARLGFEKSGTGYTVYTDYGISCPSDCCLKGFFEAGQQSFESFSELKDFFRITAASLYSSVNTSASDVVDREELTRLMKSRTEEETKPLPSVTPSEIAAALGKRVFGQDDVIMTISEKIAVNMMRKESRLLTIGLIGPTATGKSQTARAAAEVMSELYKIPYGFIEIAGNEFLGEHSVNRFFGAPAGYVGHGSPTLLEPVRKNPCHVIVINEIEKADEKLLTGLMEAIDTGHLGMADNTPPIDLSRCIMFFTSNLPVDEAAYRSLDRFAKEELCRDLFTEFCGRPEISGKICNFAVFKSLDDNARTDIIIKFVREELADFGITLRGIDTRLMCDLLQHDTKYGARGIRSMISSSVGLCLVSGSGTEKLREQGAYLSGTAGNISIKPPNEPATYIEYDKRKGEISVKQKNNGQTVLGQCEDDKSTA